MRLTRGKNSKFLVKEPTSPRAATESAQAEADSRMRGVDGSPVRPDSGYLRPGSTVGEYQIEALIGRGGMGCVYAARQPLIGKRVAIKELCAEMTHDASLVRRFVDEARAVNQIRHPNIIDIFSFGQLVDGRHYFVMELLEGQTLRDRMSAGPIGPVELERYLAQICSALEAAHNEQIVHRDLKPENIWIATPRHGESYVKLLDFGIAKLLGNPPSEPLTQLGAALGTPPYMSPEQCEGGALDQRTDIYALGVMLYEIYAGRQPYQGSAMQVLVQHVSAPPPPLSQFVPVPQAIEALIMACLEKQPDRRPQRALEVLEKFRRATSPLPPSDELNKLGLLPTAVSLPPLAVTHAPPPRRARGLALRSRVWLVLLLALAAGALFLALRLRSRPEVADHTLSPAMRAPSAVQATPPDPQLGAADGPPTLPLPAAEHNAAPAVALPETAHDSKAASHAPAAKERAVSAPKTPDKAARQGLATDNPFR